MSSSILFQNPRVLQALSQATGTATPAPATTPAVASMGTPAAATPPAAADATAALVRRNKLLAQAGGASTLGNTAPIRAAAAKPAGTIAGSGGTYAASTLGGS